MVVIHVKRGDQSQFLYETVTTQTVDDLMNELCEIYNGRLKVYRICDEIEQLAEHGISLPAHMQGILPQQIEELKLTDEWTNICIPSGGHILKPDPMLKRNGCAPNPRMVELIQRTITDAKSKIDKKLIAANICLKISDVQDALDQLKGLMMIVYPMGLPPYDPIRIELEGKEILQNCKDVIPPANVCLWFSGKEMLKDKKISDYTGKNEKTKVILKIQQKGHGAPPREPLMSEIEQRNLTAFFYKKQEEMKRLEEDEDDSYLNSPWADSDTLRKSIHGVDGIRWK